MSLGAIGAGLSAFAGARERRLEREAREAELAKRETDRGIERDYRISQDAQEEERYNAKMLLDADKEARASEQQRIENEQKQNERIEGSFYKRRDDARAQAIHDAAMAKQDKAQEADMSEEDADFIRIAYGAYALQAGQTPMALRAFNKGIPEDSPERVVAIYNQEWNYESGQPIALKLADGTERIIKSSVAADALAHRARKHNYAGPNKVTGGEELPPLSAADRQEMLNLATKFYNLPRLPSKLAIEADPSIAADYERSMEAYVAAVQRGDSIAEAAELAGFTRKQSAPDSKKVGIENQLKAIRSEIAAINEQRAKGIQTPEAASRFQKLMDEREALTASMKAYESERQKTRQDPGAIRWQKSNSPQFRQTPTGTRQIGPPAGPAPGRGIVATPASTPTTEAPGMGIGTAPDARAAVQPDTESASGIQAPQDQNAPNSDINRDGVIDKRDREIEAALWVVMNPDEAKMLVSQKKLTLRQIARAEEVVKAFRLQTRQQATRSLESSATGAIR